MYRIDTLSDEGAIKEEDDNGGEILIPQPNRLQLSFEKVSATGKGRTYDLLVTCQELKTARLQPLSCLLFTQ